MDLENYTRIAILVGFYSSQYIWFAGRSQRNNIHIPKSSKHIGAHVEPERMKQAVEQGRIEKVKVCRVTLSRNLRMN